MNIHTHNIYLRPILEYASVIWYQCRKTLNEQLEKSLHTCTRTALRRTHRSDHPWYLPFHQRMSTPKLLTLEDRRCIASIIMAHNIINTTSDLPLKAVLLSYRNTRTNTRSANTFTIPIHVPTKSPLCIMMNDVDHHHRKIADITTDSQNIIKKKLTKYFAAIIRQKQHLWKWWIYYKKTWTWIILTKREKSIITARIPRSHTKLTNATKNNDAYTTEHNRRMNLSQLATYLDEVFGHQPRSVSVHDIGNQPPKSIEWITQNVI